MDRCVICSSEFRRKYSRGGQRKMCCSRKCSYKRKVQLLPFRPCKTCGKMFRNTIRTKSEFCSVSCFQRTPCILCGKIIIGRATFQSGKRRFCGRACASLVNKGAKSKIKYAVFGFVATLRKTGKIACERCGFDNPFGLTVHHKDRDRSNNAFENLETLCATCHQIEHWSESKKRTKDIFTATRYAQHFDQIEAVLSVTR